MGLLDRVRESRRAREATALEIYQRALWADPPDADALLAAAEAAGRTSEQVEADVQTVEEARALMADAARCAAAEKAYQAADVAHTKAVAEYNGKKARLDADLAKAKDEWQTALGALQEADHARDALINLRGNRPEVMAGARMPAAVVEAEERVARERRRHQLQARLHQAEQARRDAERGVREAQVDAESRIDFDALDVKGRLSRRKAALEEAEKAEAEARKDLEALND